MPGGRAAAVADLQEKIASIRKRKETLEGHRQTLDDTGEAQLSLTDPDSRSMHSGDTGRSRLQRPDRCRH